jgi:hypothetical protein
MSPYGPSCRLVRCGKSATIRGTPVVALTHSDGSP